MHVSLVLQAHVRIPALWILKILWLLTVWACRSGLKRQLQVKILIAYVIIGWLVTEIFFFGIWCRPFMNYFRVMENIDRKFMEHGIPRRDFAADNCYPLAGCSTSQHHLIMSFAFNLSSDVLMLTVPIPMLLQSQLPIKQFVFLHPWILARVFGFSTDHMLTYYVHRKITITGVFSLGIFVVSCGPISQYHEREGKKANSSFPRSSLQH